ncbi:LOW QUALITY PROTEIN: uncharacterized protein LOC127576463 [Pristis pectinata]|uniref:LOW QUALITY PROTEIN: uncharacterized protein LOC127576463 n=1 Tax=Pristis pectinata TaxID=685728 RepID=UPI00223CEB1A|nr:LOW QUALITY PROTEIN: uncharacterized protein LOC127576463 [Pristis pectinata]
MNRPPADTDVMEILWVFTASVCLHRTFCRSVTQSPTIVNRKECQSLTIKCRFQSGLADKFQTGHFFKQTQPGAEWQRLSGGGRFVTSTNKAEMTFTLEIRNLRVADSSTYYCQAEYTWKTQWGIYYMYGTGSTVTVTSGSISSQSQRLQYYAGDTVTLNCEYSGFCPYTVHWYLQLPGHAPKFLFQRHTSGEQDKENVPGGRISGSLDSSEKLSRLTISKVQVNDSAVYHCALSPRPALHSHTEYGESRTKTSALWITNTQHCRAWRAVQIPGEFEYRHPTK